MNILEKSIIDDFQKIVDLVDKSKNLELYNTILGLEVKIYELNKEKRNIGERNEELEELLKFKGKLTFNTPVYYLEGEPTPFCPNCWEGESRAIHLTVQRDSRTGRCQCQKCKAWYDTKDEPYMPQRFNDEYDSDY